MSAEQREPDAVSSLGDRPLVSATRDDCSLHHSTAGSDPHEPPLSYQIERTRLRARITALERALETSESRRQEVIEQYERLLTDRESGTEPAGSESKSAPLREFLSLRK